MTSSDQQMIALSTLADRGRALLALTPLSPRQRQLCLGKWFSGAHDFAQRAASYLSHFAGRLGAILPFGPADIEAQRQRYL